MRRVATRTTAEEGEVRNGSKPFENPEYLYSLHTCSSVINKSGHPQPPSTLTFLGDWWADALAAFWRCLLALIRIDLLQKHVSMIPAL
jgi:hypothetical protein